MGKTTSQGVHRPWQRVERYRAALKPALAVLALIAALTLPGGPSLPVRAEPGLRPGTQNPPAVATLELFPSSATIRVGQRLTVDLRVRDVPALAGVGLYLQFDPARLQVVDTMPGVQIVVGGLISPTFTVQERLVDNSGGLISFAAYHRPKVGPSPSGSGTLIRFTFEGLSPGGTVVTILTPETTLVSPEGVEFDYVAVDGTITVLPSVACRNCIVNGGFESAPLTGWRATSHVQLSPPGHTGAFCAWLGGYSNADDILTQTLTIVPDAVSVTLQYWYQVRAQETAIPGDYLLVQLCDQAGTLLALLDQWSNAGADSAWHQSAPADLTAYAGQTVQLRFRATCDGTGFTDFYIDDVTLDVCGPTAGRVYLPLVLTPPAGAP